MKKIKKNWIYYIYSKPSYFVKNCYSINILRKKQINSILKDYFKAWKEIKRGEIAIKKYTPKFRSDIKYLYIET